MSTVSPNTLVEAEKVLAALKLGASFNWKGALADFESENTQAKIQDGLIAAEDIAQIVGLFLPPAAMAAEYIGIVVAVEPFVYRALAWVLAQPMPKKVAGLFATWGQTTRSTVTVHSESQHAARNQDSRGRHACRHLRLVGPRWHQRCGSDGGSGRSEVSTE